MKIGIVHTTLADAAGHIVSPGDVARRAEAVGLDSLWASDHLAWDTPILDSLTALAAAAAVTTRLEVGTGVLQLALRNPAWAAKQIGTVQAIAGGRLQLGVGIGGAPVEEWAAAGVPVTERAARTDRVLEALPRLLAGEETDVPEAGGARIRLQPPVPMPRVWIGGGSRAALRRTARYGDAWLPAGVTPEQVRDGNKELAALAAEEGRAVPGVGVGVFAALGAESGGMDRNALAGMLSSAFGMTLEHAGRVAVGGDPREVADRLAEYAVLGVEHVTVTSFGGSWERQCDLLAEARQLL
ncbi:MULTISPECIES: LLM class flavin-dependent oxidoreductase [Nocardiopsis]|uniref:LLM class flavin-dependent oxidoreductase n=1 Tax=Nocardiopsis TaxID=2013 RepID=UPI00037C0F4F|nr:MULTISPECIES: LLM class flavin-dependent oxidoreductase [Nocardiopsis]